MLFSIITILILIILLYLTTYSKNETFVNRNTIPISQWVIMKYKYFVNFYNPFMKNWEEAIVTIQSLDTPQQEASKPSQAPSSSKPSIPTREQLNQYIQSYSQKIGKSLPFITEPLSDDIYSYSLQQLLEIIPSDPTPYQNALSLMNNNLIESQKNLDSALQGKITEGFFMIEGYTGDQCAELSTCFAENPQIAEQIAKAQYEQELKKHEELQNQLSDRLEKFILNNTLQNALQMNNNLVKKAKELQNKAQSGELLNMINIPDLNPIPPYKVPAGGNRLKQLKESDPDKYNELEKKNSALFSVKTLFEQINQNLR